MEDFNFGLFDDLLEGEPHPLEIEEFEDEQDYKRKLKEKKLNIYEPTCGEARLHRAIRSGKQIEINALLELYQEDFDRVRDHLVAKYQWDVEDKVWLRKTILVASTEEQCQSAKNLENLQVDAEAMRRAVTIGAQETFMQVAASKGSKRVIDRLYELGAPIAIPGHNPLMQAIRNNRKEMPGQMCEMVERAIQKYNLTLSHRWKNYVVLGRMIERKIALKYCFEGIRNDPQLLGLTEYDTITILHQLVAEGHLEFVREMYTKHPDVIPYFNTDQAFEVMRKAINEESRETVQFVLEQHGEYLKCDLDKLRDHVVCCQYYTNEFYERRRAILMEFFPEFRENVLSSEEKVSSCVCYDSITDFDKMPKPYSIIRGSNGETLLHLAAERDDKELFVRMLEGGCELDALDNDGNHAVHLVKSEKMVDLIVDRHPQGRNLIHRTNNDGSTVLHKVCQQYMDVSAHVALLEKVIAYGADVNQLNNHGESAVFFVRNSHLLDVLRKHGAQLDLANQAGETALERHLVNYNVCVANSLLTHLHDRPCFKQHAHKYLAPMMRYSRDFFSCDYQKFLEAHPESARVMFDSVCGHSREEASRLFAKACNCAFIYISEMFLSGNYDLDYNYKFEYNNTPLIGLLNYMELPNLHIVKQLLEKKGVDVQVKNECGWDALLTLVRGFRSARGHGHGLETVQLLLDHGASIHTTGDDGNTALHLAFADGEMELVELQVGSGKVFRDNSSTMEEFGSFDNRLEEIKLDWKDKSIYEPVSGDTRLHRAIRSGNQVEINGLIEVYREDFDKVRDYLVSKYQWDVEDKIWLRKTILVASTEEQCWNANKLEKRLVDTQELRRAVLVLLQHPVSNEEVAVLHPNAANRAALAKLITILTPNGVLTWNYVSKIDAQETVMQVAASNGLNRVIDRLYELGAPITTPGHNPLMQAVGNNRQDTVVWLLTDHFDHFDCTLRDEFGRNALVAAMENNVAFLFDLVLEKMIAYRLKYCNETEEEAFHEIFLLKNEYDNITTFEYIRKDGLVFECVEKAIEKYKLKLTYRWKNYTILGRLICYKVALDYCFESIRSDPQLLGLKEYEAVTALQFLVTEEHLNFVREMYTKHPEVKTYLNTDKAYEVLWNAINDGSHETVQFILEHHGEFLKKDLVKLKDQVVCYQYHTKEFYETHQDLLVEFFPEFREVIQESMAKATSSRIKRRDSSPLGYSREEASRLFSKACGGALVYVSEMFLSGNYDLDYNFKHDFDNTPLIGLFDYMEEPNLHIVKQLLERGVDVQVKNCWGRDALPTLVRGFRLAKRYGHGVETVQLLLDHGAAIHTTDLDGNTPLHLAFVDGDAELVEFLVQNGADLGAVNCQGKRPNEMVTDSDKTLFYIYD
ncbi:hypothetical protein pipiens_013332 [Culex pipiens pipiens]|uniref:Uncharacterized protein n=1 Tax=Culex pipiens pipiens TaxID=38569 RepID=A0ABD1CYS1_CULPP